MAFSAVMWLTPYSWAMVFSDGSRPVNSPDVMRPRSRAATWLYSGSGLS